MDKDQAEPKVTRQMLIEEIDGLQKALPELMSVPRIFVNDSTPEGLQTELAENQERSAVLSDEGNFFPIMSGLYSNGRTNLDAILQGHAGGPLRVKRCGREVQLNKIALALGLAVQPQVLKDLRGGTAKTFRGKGVLARFLYAVPPSNIGTRDVRQRASIPPAVKSAYHAGIKALLTIKPLLDGHQVEQARMLTLSTEALAAWQDFAQAIENEQGTGGKYEHHQDFTGKLPGQALRIAALCHVAGNYEAALSTSSPSSTANEITKETLIPVLELCQKLIIHAQAAIDLLGRDEVFADAQWALEWILKHAEADDRNAFYFKQNDLHCASRFKNSKLDRVMKAVDILRERNITSGQFKLNTRKPTYIYYVNPTVVKEWK